MLTKVFVSRIKPLKQYLVSSFQSSFVRRRLTSCNIIIILEIIHSLQQKKSKTVYMIMKIDLKQACDKIEWLFLLDTLRDLIFQVIGLRLSMNASGVIVFWFFEMARHFPPFLPREV